MKHDYVWGVFLTVILGCAANGWCGEIVVFDSHSDAAWGGISSPNNGVTTQVSVTQELTISRFAVLNEMLSPGELRFAILSYPEPQFLYLSAPQAFDQDLTDQQTWKLSDPLTFTFEAGSTYLVGYLRSVEVNEYIDTVAESSAGITSDLYSHSLNGFSNPTYSHRWLSGGDTSVRLYVPEPGSALLFAGVLGLLIRRR